MGALGIEAFLTYLAVERKVAASTPEIADMTAQTVSRLLNSGLLAVTAQSQAKVANASCPLAGTNPGCAVMPQCL